jgi:hypothetical protein
MLHNADGLRASERKHAVEDVDCDRDFGVPPGIGPRPQAVADDLPKQANCGLDSGTFVVAGDLLPTDPANSSHCWCSRSQRLRGSSVTALQPLETDEQWTRLDFDPDRI